uniref:Uncharacterized protein n=1 Tax=Chromera velia CCMP2878 TaxID=1169474 RepID=A0A0G4IB91_9ALVE|eukprot:Cvel_2137.t1-p1 / transcript=Cvel_2137.t1 / gene=Cvel_2137 / organism=Chromera_velia_CCMP2878 / gene_product=hypothetical protein / transcript_product=hypothetical protein / location=Cvel_scaffold83:337-5966(-) / protein_length=248 / sequence_SO=supercontig / SO=protein_coding / is_pseudo=false
MWLVLCLLWTTRLATRDAVGLQLTLDHDREVSMAHQGPDPSSSFLDLTDSKAHQKPSRYIGYVVGVWRKAAHSVSNKVVKPARDVLIPSCKVAPVDETLDEVVDEEIGAPAPLNVAADVERVLVEGVPLECHGNLDMIMNVVTLFGIPKGLLELGTEHYCSKIVDKLLPAGADGKRPESTEEYERVMQRFARPARPEVPPPPPAPVPRDPDKDTPPSLQTPPSMRFPIAAESPARRQSAHNTITNIHP